MINKLKIKILNIKFILHLHFIILILIINKEIFLNLTSFFLNFL